MELGAGIKKPNLVLFTRQQQTTQNIGDSFPLPVTAANQVCS